MRVELLPLFNYSQLLTRFKIINPQPINGVSITPTQGEIKPRCVFPLHLNIKIPSVQKAKFKVQISINDQYTIASQVKVEVEPPKFRIEPNHLKLPRTWVGNTSYATFHLTNIGTVEAQASIKLNPEASNFRLETTSYNNDKRYPMFLAPNKTEVFELIFTPTELSTRNYLIPLVINDIEVSVCESEVCHGVNLSEMTLRE